MPTPRRFLKRCYVVISPRRCCWLPLLLVLVASVSRADAAGPNLMDYFHACGIGGEALARFSDDRQIAEEELGVIRSIAVRLRDCPPSRLEDLIQGEISVADRKLPSPAEAKGQRGRMFKVQGTVTSVEPVADPDAESLWRYTVTLSERPYRAVVYLASPNTAAGGQRVEFDGLFAKYVPGTGAEQMAVFVAPRLERRGDSPLANLGMDLGLLEGIRDYSPMTAADHDAFYHLLLLARNADLARLQRDAEQLDGSPRGLPALFSAPAAQRGRLVRLAGMVQRVVRVPVDDAAVAARLGADHFFEIDLMAEGSQGNPLVFCTLDLPAGMPLVEQPSSGEQVDVTGFFFKTWQYPVKLSQAEKDASPGSTWARQPAPLVIGPAPLWKPAAQEKKSSTAPAIGVFVLLAMIGVCLLLWHFRQSDEESFRQVVARE